MVSTMAGMGIVAFLNISAFTKWRFGTLTSSEIKELDPRVTRLQLTFIPSESDVINWTINSGVNVSNTNGLRSFIEFEVIFQLKNRHISTPGTGVFVEVFGKHHLSDSRFFHVSPVRTRTLVLRKTDTAIGDDEFGIGYMGTLAWEFGFRIL